jgi:drug/metabolite transporter superfamily protein YnfA
VERLLIIEGCSCWQGCVRSVVGTSSGGGCGSTSPSCGRYSGGVLAAYGVVAALQPISEFGRVYAAYGGIFITLALLWGITVDGFRPDRWDLLGAALCVEGVVVMVAPSRG